MSDAREWVVRVLPRHRLPEVSRLAFEWYCSDPTFAGLYGVTTRDELAPVRRVFDGMLDEHPHYPGFVRGAFVGRRLVGMVASVPVAVGPIWPILLRRPLLVTWLLLRSGALRLRQRFVLRGVMRRRWRLYCALAAETRRALRRTPRLCVSMLAVDPEWRRCGVASHLLDAVAADDVAASCSFVEVATWSREKAQMYEAMGFVERAVAARDGLECHTLLRAIP